MKVAIVVLALATIAFTAPQPRKVFHEHFDDFMDVIGQEAGEELEQLLQEYLQSEEFLVSVDYIKTNNFKNLVYEMESLPEFKAVVEFLEKDNIDILFFIDRINEMLESFSATRQQTRGKDLESYINDSIALFPKEKLAALYDLKMAEDDAFRVTMENLNSDEWHQTFNALWKSETFQAEIHALTEHGIDAHAVLHEIKAIFGQD